MTEQTSSRQGNALRLFTVEFASTEPWWQSYLGLPPNHFKPGSRQGAVAIVQVADRPKQHIVFTFGPVTHMLDMKSLVHDFGLQLAAHHIVPTEVLAAETEDASEARRQRTQLAQGRRLDFVDPDVAQRGVRRVTARAGAQFPGAPETITGGTSLRFSTLREFDNLDRLAREIFEKYETRKDPVISLGAMRKVQDASLVDAAEEALLKAFVDDGDVIFAYPGIVEDSKPVALSFKSEDRRSPFDGVDLSPFRAALAKRMGAKRPPTPSTLKNAVVKVFDEDGEETTIPLHKCLTATVTMGAHELVLFEGSWHEVETSYMTSVRKEISNLGAPRHPYPTRIDGDFEEVDYNYRAATSLDGLSLDRTSVSGKGFSSIEPCDIIRLDEDVLVLTHVKPGQASSNLSHLFYQAQVATTTLLLDSTARKELRTVIRSQGRRASYGLPKPKENSNFTRVNELTPREKERRRVVSDDLLGKVNTAIARRRLRVEFVILHGSAAKKGDAASLGGLPLFSQMALARAARVFRQLDVPMNVRFVDDARTHASPASCTSP